jgi:hypothetical protein
MTLRRCNGFHLNIAKPARRVVERWTRDAIVPVAADIDDGWRCIPIPPSIFTEWEIVDSSKDRKTGWARARRRQP